MNSHITEIFEQFGLSAKEQEVYFTLLKIGSASAPAIGKRLGIPKSTCQYICSKITKKKLFSSIEKNNSIIYSIEPPEKLLYLINQAKKLLDARTQNILINLSKLKAMQNPQAILPKIQFFEGPDAINQTYQTAISEIPDHSELISFAKPITDQEIYQHVWKSLKTFIKQCVKKNIYTRALLVRSPESKILQKDDSKNFSETKIIDSKIFPFDGAEMFIYKNTIWTIAIQNHKLFSYKVESEVSANLYRALFEYAWQQTVK